MPQSSIIRQKPLEGLKVFLLASVLPKTSSDRNSRKIVESHSVRNNNFGIVVLDKHGMTLLSILPKYLCRRQRHLRQIAIAGRINFATMKT